MLKVNGHKVSKKTIANILKEHGIKPAPERDRLSSWRRFLTQQRDVIWGSDFFTVDILKNGVVPATFYVLFFINHATRRVVIGGITEHPHEEWMCQVARNLTGWDGELEGAKYVLHDQDKTFSLKYRQILSSAGIKPRKLPIASPDLNSVAERVVRSIKEDCLNELMFFSEKQLRRAINQYLDFYHTERPHQGEDIGNNILFPDERADANRTGKVIKSSRLGGLLNFYYREDQNAA